MSLGSIVHYGILDPSSGWLSYANAVHNSTIAMTLDNYSRPVRHGRCGTGGDGRCSRLNPGCGKRAPATEPECVSSTPPPKRHPRKRRTSSGGCWARLPRRWRNRGVSIDTTQGTNAKPVLPFHDEEEHRELRRLPGELPLRDTAYADEAIRKQLEPDPSAVEGAPDRRDERKDRERRP
jgi:hypothetical protein